MIKVKDLYFSYTKDFNILHNISFELKTGKQMVIVGNKDSGRSSLLRVLIGLDKPSKGEICIKDISLNKINLKNDISLGYLPTLGAFLDNKTVKENLEYVLNIRHIPKDIISVKVNNAILSYNLDIIKDQKVKKLSYFDKIKISLARFSLREINMFVIDDIFEELEDKERNYVVSEIKKLIKSNSATAVVVTSSNEVADTLGYARYNLEYGSLEKVEKKKSAK